MICTGLLQGICLGLLFLQHIKAQMEATFSGCFLGPYKVRKIGYCLFSYALQPDKHSSTSFMGAILEEYLVEFFHDENTCIFDKKPWFPTLIALVSSILQPCSETNETKLANNLSKTFPKSVQKVGI